MMMIIKQKKKIFFANTKNFFFHVCALLLRKCVLNQWVVSPWNLYFYFSFLIPLKATIIFTPPVSNV